MNIPRISALQFSNSISKKPSIRPAHVVNATNANKAKFPKYLINGPVLVENPYNGEYLRKKEGVWYVHPDPNGPDDVPKNKRLTKDPITNTYN